MLPSLFLTFFPPLSLSYPPIPSPGLEGKNKQNKSPPALKVCDFSLRRIIQMNRFPASLLFVPTPHPPLGRNTGHGCRPGDGPREARGVKNKGCGGGDHCAPHPRSHCGVLLGLPTWCLGFLFATKGSTSETLVDPGSYK